MVQKSFASAFPDKLSVVNENIRKIGNDTNEYSHIQHLLQDAITNSLCPWLLDTCHQEDKKNKRKIEI